MVYNTKSAPDYESHPVQKCRICGDDIFEGDTVYHFHWIDGEEYYICEDCIDSLRTTVKGK